MPFLIALVFLFTAAQLSAETADTADLYAAWRDRVLQVQVIDRQAGSKAGIGSGFVTGKPGWIVTNYHVISEMVNQPGRYRSRFLADGGVEGDLELLSVDAVHDLALLKSSMTAVEPLPLAVAAPPHGTRVWSMGYPFDIGLTIVEGTYNGMLEKSLYEKLHFTGSINPGMSGGPALNESGQVVGVNVSTAGNQVSFLVPVQFVTTLLEQSSGLPASEDQLNHEVAGQLLENQQRIASELLGREVSRTRLEGYDLPGSLASYINCWGNSEDDDEDELALVYYRCQTQDDIFLSSALSTGIIRYQHDLISTDQLHPMRFYHQLENRGYYPQLRLDGDEQTVTNYQCRSDFIDHSGLPMKATFCVRRYRKLDGLYDVYLNITSLLKSQEALQSTLLLAGFSWDNLSALSARFIESISWQGEEP